MTHAKYYFHCAIPPNIQYCAAIFATTMLRIFQSACRLEKSLTLLGNGASPDGIQRRNAGRQSRNGISRKSSKPQNTEVK